MYVRNIRNIVCILSNPLFSSIYSQFRSNILRMPTVPIYLIKAITQIAHNISNYFVFLSSDTEDTVISSLA